MLMLRVLLLFCFFFPISSFAKGPNPSHQALREALNERFGPSIRVSWNHFSKTPRAVLGLKVPVAGESPVERARTFLKANADLFAVDELSEPRLTAVRGRHTVHFEQMAQGLQVEGRTIAVSLDSSGAVRRVVSDFVPLQLDVLRMDIGVEGALSAARTVNSTAPLGTVEKVILASATGVARIAYRVTQATLPPMIFHNLWIDAETGRLLRRSPVGRDLPQEVVR